MFFGRAKELLEGSGDLLRAEAELAGQRVRRALVNSAALVGCAGVAASGVGLVLGAVGVEIAHRWGLTAALGSIGSGLFLLGIAGVGVVLWRRETDDDKDDGPDSVQEAAQDVADAKRDMGRAVDPDRSETKEDGEEDDVGNTDLEHMKDAAVDFAVKNPLAVASGALLVVSLLGPGRTVRMVSRGVAAAGLVGTLLDALASGGQGEGGNQPSPDPQPQPPSPSNAESVGGRMNGSRVTA